MLEMFLTLHTRVGSQSLATGVSLVALCLFRVHGCLYFFVGGPIHKAKWVGGGGGPIHNWGPEDSALLDGDVGGQELVRLVDLWQV